MAHQAENDPRGPVRASGRRRGPLPLHQLHASHDARPAAPAPDPFSWPEDHLSASVLELLDQERRRTHAWRTIAGFLARELRPAVPQHALTHAAQRIEDLAGIPELRPQDRPQRTSDLLNQLRGRPPQRGRRRPLPPLRRIPLG